MRTFFGVCLLVIGGWLLTLLDMLLFFDILVQIRTMLFAISALASALVLALGLWAVKARRCYVLGMTLLLSALAVWATVIAFCIVDSHPQWSHYLPTDFAESFSNLSLAFAWLTVQTLAGMVLIWRCRKA